MTYSFRIRVNRSPTDAVACDGRSFALAVDTQEVPISLRSKDPNVSIEHSDQLILRGTGYPSQTEADYAGRQRMLNNVHRLTSQSWFYDRSHDDAMAELFREDPTFATEYLNSVLEDGEQADLLVALRQMAKAFGGVLAIAERAQLNPTQLYRTLSPEGNPELQSLSAILKAMGLRLAVQPLVGASIK